RHLAGMAGMYAVVAVRCPEQDRRIRLSGRGEMVWRNLLEEGPILRDIGIAVFGGPAGASQKLALTAHFEQRDGAANRNEALPVAREHVADQEPAIAAAVAGEAARTRDTAANKVGSNSGEVVVRALLALANPSLVPGRAELAAAADIGDHVNAAAFE